MNQTKLDELIKKWEGDLKHISNFTPTKEKSQGFFEGGIYQLQECIKDLKSLQSEQEVEIKKANVEYYKQYKDEGEEGWDGLCTCNYFVCSEEKYCGNCGKKIVWID